MFFDLHARGLLAGHDVTLTDNNPDLIACYRAVRDCPEQVIGELSRLAVGHERGGAAHYYEVRNERFNPQRAALAAASNGECHYSPSLAAMFIYLNRTGYNGLFRLNSDGQFNVPAGRYAKPRICDDASLRRVARALARTGVTLDRARFDRAVDSAVAGDFLYFDPPYAPLSKTARFTSYTTDGFDAGEQERLRDVVIALAKRGCHVMLSNSTAPEIVRLYEEQQGREGGRAEVLQDTRAAGDQLKRRTPRRGGRVCDYERSPFARSPVSLRFAHCTCSMTSGSPVVASARSLFERLERPRGRRSCRAQRRGFFAAL